MPLPERPLKIPGLEYAELEGLDETICLDPEDGSSFSLNTTAVTILDLCDGKRSLEDIADIICDSVGVEKSQPLKDIRTILEQFAELGLIYSG